MYDLPMLQQDGPVAKLLDDMIRVRGDHNDFASVQKLIQSLFRFVYE
jgi:hypothetical protein